MGATNRREQTGSTGERPLRHFSTEEVKDILDADVTSEFKQKLNENTQKALDSGAPWFWVRNEDGEEEPFSGVTGMYSWVCNRVE